MIFISQGDGRDIASSVTSYITISAASTELMFKRDKGTGHATALFDFAAPQNNCSKLWFGTCSCIRSCCIAGAGEVVSRKEIETMKRRE